MEQILNSYYADNAKKLHGMIDKILFKLHFINIDKDDFYSLGNEVFAKAMNDYNQKESFDGFLYSCLYKKFCTEMARRTRDKRCTKIKAYERDERGNPVTKIMVIQDESLDAPIGEDGSPTLGDTIESNITIEGELFSKSEEGFSRKMLLYLNRLSGLQKEVLRLNIAGYLPNEIMEELHISKRQYADCFTAIRSYRNVSVLF